MKLRQAGECVARLLGRHWPPSPSLAACCCREVGQEGRKEGEVSERRRVGETDGEGVDKIRQKGR